MNRPAALFPGQGAQTVGMAKDLIEAHPEARSWFDQASEVLGFDLAGVCFEGPQEELTRSDRAQPAIFVHSVVAYELFRARTGFEPAAAAGLSSGEWAALYAAGVVSFGDAIRVLRARGQLMQAACEAQPSGMVTIIGLDEDKVQALADELGVQVANYNSPGQTVVSGARPAIDAVPERAKAAGAKLAKALPVAGAFHSQVMAPAAQAFAAFLQDIPLAAPRFPVYSNVTGLRHGDPASIRQQMAAQITGSVQWVKNVQAMVADGVQSVVEFGPGKVLTGLVKRIDNNVLAANVADLSSLEASVGLLNA